jgi:hypothetical protein
MICICIIFLFTTNFFSLGSSLSINQNYRQYIEIDAGHILFAPMNSQTTYLIDKTGAVTYTWESNYLPGEAVYWVNDGTIIRTIKIVPLANGAGGGFQKVTWDGTVVWEYRYCTDQVLSHHDIEPLPNGNVLMIAWETKTRNEAIAAGRNPNKVGSIFRPDHIIEVKKTGPTTGEIVWEWHVWDHLIQDYDPSKANYGVVGDHPELIDINYGNSKEDWLHCNSVDYNEKFDQILICSKYFHEIWVIDHSTTIAEAAGHTGGNSGKGGDILYRWGNPATYRAGTIDDEMLFSQHDATWIESSYPGAGNILIFNNGKNRPNIQYSSVDEIVPPVDNNGNYYLASGAAYGPETPIWSYTANPLTSFYADFLSGCQRLPNGNTLICDGPAGRFFEVTPEKETVWEYVNTYPAPLFNNVFKIQYIAPAETSEGSDLNCEGILQWTNIKKGEEAYGSFIVRNIGNSSSLLNWTINSFPTWGTWEFIPDSGVHLTPEEGSIIVNVSVVAPNKLNRVYKGALIVVNTNDPQDFEIIPIYLKTLISRSFFFYLKNQYFFKIVQRILK